MTNETSPTPPSTRRRRAHKRLDHISTHYFNNNFPRLRQTPPRTSVQQEAIIHNSTSTSPAENNCLCANDNLAPTDAINQSGESICECTECDHRNHRNQSHLEITNARVATAPVPLAPFMQAQRRFFVDGTPGVQAPLDFQTQISMVQAFSGVDMDTSTRPAHNYMNESSQVQQAAEWYQWSESSFVSSLSTSSEGNIINTPCADVSGRQWNADLGSHYGTIQNTHLQQKPRAYQAASHTYSEDDHNHIGQFHSVPPTTGAAPPFEHAPIPVSIIPHRADAYVAFTEQTWFSVNELSYQQPQHNSPIQTTHSYPIHPHMDESLDHHQQTHWQNTGPGEFPPFEAPGPEFQ